MICLMLLMALVMEDGPCNNDPPHHHHHASSEMFSRVYDLHKTTRMVNLFQ